MANPTLTRSLEQFDQIATELSDRLAPLSAAQLNHKPDAKTWSAAEVLQHLMQVHDQYRGRLEPLLDASHRPGRAARWGVGAQFFGKMLKGVTHPKSVRKTRTIRPFEPSRSAFDASVVAEFAEHTHAFRKLLAQIPERRYAENISSPAGTWVVLPVRDVVQLLGNHLERHRNQIIRAIAAN